MASHTQPIPSLSADQEGLTDIVHLIGLVQAYNPDTDEDLLRHAFAYGQKAHDGQFRKSGEPYFTHPFAVATLLTEQRLDDATLVTALLHDTIEDTGSTFDEIGECFSPEIAGLVDGVTKLTNLELSSPHSQQAENFRKLVMAVSRDPRVLLVKLADRLHNMRTIRAMRPEKQQQKARETMDIYAPLAGRMGMQSMREELEDLSFRVLNPEARSSIMRRYISMRTETGNLIPQITQDIRAALDEIGVLAEVWGREKKPYSIWRKMEEKKEGFSRLSDIYGFRIIVENVNDCYRALGAVHQAWSAVPGRFKDYISQPKSNGYRSIHTTVSGRSAKRVEIQIRTREMNDVAESGVAAHWSYRDGARFENPFAVDPFRWLKSLTEGLADSDHPDDFMDIMKLEMFQDQVFCFTPKGEVIKLPRGATPLDFAYAIHTRIGDSCVGAKVDAQRVPLWTRLRNGQSVTIIRAEGQRPQESWMDIVQTGRAKAAIRRSLREENREGYIRLGREIARIALERVGKPSTTKALATAAKELNLGSGDELLARLGSTELVGRDLVSALYPELLDSQEDKDPSGTSTSDGIIGIEAGQNVISSPCCCPIPGERIVGIAVQGRGVMLHTIDCEELAQFEDEADQWLDLRWPEGPQRAEHLAMIDVAMVNDAGVLGRLCTLVGEQKANIVDIMVTERKPDFYRMVIDVEVRDVKHLHNVKTALEADSDVSHVARVRGKSYMML